MQSLRGGHFYIYLARGSGAHPWPPVSYATVHWCLYSPKFCLVKHDVHDKTNKCSLHHQAVIKLFYTAITSTCVAVTIWRKSCTWRMHVMENYQKALLPFLLSFFFSSLTSPIVSKFFGCNARCNANMEKSLGNLVQKKPHEKRCTVYESFKAEKNLFC